MLDDRCFQVHQLFRVGKYVMHISCTCDMRWVGVTYPWLNRTSGRRVECDKILWRWDKLVCNECGSWLNVPQTRVATSQVKGRKTKELKTGQVWKIAMASLYSAWLGRWTWRAIVWGRANVKMGYDGQIERSAWAGQPTFILEESV